MRISKEKTLSAILSAFIFFSILSCDKVAPPYRKSAAGIVSERKVLIEDFTGHTCPNCPKAAKEADTLSNYIYKGNVIVVSLHVAQFADTFPSGPFTYNFKTATGTDIDNYFKISVTGLPKGMINRVGYPASQQKEYADWGSEISQILVDDLLARIEIKNSYDTISRVINTQVKSTFAGFLIGAYKLCVWYTEDSIVQPQINYTAPPIIQNYVHMHALRGAFNGTWGDLLKINPNANDSVTKQYSMQIKADAIPKNCHVVAFIYNDATKEILQAEEQKIVE